MGGEGRQLVMLKSHSRKEDLEGRQERDVAPIRKGGRGRVEGGRGGAG